MIERSRDQHLSQIRSLAQILDSRFEGPYGWRFGLDGIIGLIPVVGDIVTSSFSFYILYGAAMMGCPPTVILRMGLNILLENLADMIPLVGNLFDFYWKANQKNVALLENYLIQPRQTARSSQITLGLVLLFILFVLISGIYLSYLMINFLYHAIFAA